MNRCHFECFFPAGDFFGSNDAHSLSTISVSNAPPCASVDCAPESTVRKSSRRFVSSSSFTKYRFRLSASLAMTGNVPAVAIGRMEQMADTFVM